LLQAMGRGTRWEGFSLARSVSWGEGIEEKERRGNKKKKSQKGMSVCRAREKTQNVKESTMGT